MPDLIIEVMSEEIPARMQNPARVDFKNTLDTQLAEAGFQDFHIETYMTPRRMCAIVENLPEVQEDKTIEKKGPKSPPPTKPCRGF